MKTTSTVIARAWRRAATTILALMLFAGPSRAAGIVLWSDNFEDGDANCWSITNNGATIAVTSGTANGGTYSLRVTGASGGAQGALAYSRTVYVDFDEQYTIQFAFRWSDFHWDRFVVFGHVRLLLDYPSLPIKYDPVGNNSFIGNSVSATPFQSYLPANQWGWITVHCRPSDRQYDVLVNGTHAGTVTYQASVVPTNQLFFEDNHSTSNFLDAWYDDFRVTGFQTPQTYCKPGDFWIVTCTSWARPPNVPFHGQYTTADSLNEPCSPPRPSGRCVIACLQMVFGRFGDVFPVPGPLTPGAQEEMEAPANTNDRVNCPTGGWSGTHLDDARRGAHFSKWTQAATAVRNGCPPAGCPGAPGAFGYTWRDLGYSAVDSVWTDIAPVDTVNSNAGVFPSELETLVGSGYPIIALIDVVPGYCDSIRADPDADSYVECPVIPEDTVTGHACVIIGWDNVGGQGGNPHARPAFLIHDPAVCRKGWIPQQFFWDVVWPSKRFLFAAPWETQWLSPPRWHYDTPFDGTLLASYTGSRLLSGVAPVGTVQAKVTLTNIGLQGGEVLTHDLAGISATGDVGFTTWKLRGVSPVNGVNLIGVVAASAWGTLSPALSSTSYASYADRLGGGTSMTKPLSMSLAADPYDPGNYGWPYGGRWWSGGGGSGGSGIRLFSLGGSSCDLYAKVGNFGLDAIPAGTMYRFSWTDPGTCQRLPGGTFIGEVPIPPLAPGDTLTVGPVPWTRPSANGFGEPHFAILGTIECPADPPVNGWPQDENNHAALSDFPLTTLVGNPVSVQFRVENPESAPREVVLRIDKAEAPAWDVSLGLPAETRIPLAAGQTIPTSVTVTPATGDLTASVHVECFVYQPGGGLVRETGGVTLTLDVPPAGTDVLAGVGARPALALAPGRPNPFHATTTIRFGLPMDGDVALKVYDVAGRLVRVLALGRRPAGWHEAAWRGENESGARIAAGVYFVRLETDVGKGMTRKVVLVR